MPFSQTPIVEFGPIVEFYTDCYGPVEIIGPNFWLTLCRVQRECGGELVRVPIVRIGHPIATYKPIPLLIAAQKKTTIVALN